MKTNERTIISEIKYFLVCFFLHVSLVPNKRVYSSIWHPRVAWRCHKIQTSFTVFFSWKLKENKDSKFNKNFNIRRQFQHTEHYMIWAKVSKYILSLQITAMTLSHFLKICWNYLLLKIKKGLEKTKIISYDKIKNGECFRFGKYLASFNQ